MTLFSYNSRNTMLTRALRLGIKKTPIEVYESSKKFLFGIRHRLFVTSLKYGVGTK